MSDRETTATLQHALVKAYPLPEYATFFEVGDATGSHQSRWADAVSMACWPSRGLRIHGFEIKASRSDWLREKKKPQKSDAVQRYCHHWVLVTAPDVIQDGELPPAWGHMVLAGGKLRTKVAPPLLEPVALEAPFVAALLRRCGQVSAEQVAIAVREATNTAREQAKVDAERELQRRLARNDRAHQAVEQFRAETGVDLLGFDALQAGPAFAEYMKARRDVRNVFAYSASAKALRAAADALDAAAAAVTAAGIPLKDN